MYCGQADIINLEMTEKELISLTDDNRQGQVGSDMVTACIERADAEIDKYIGSRYSVPLGTVPALIKGWSATIAAFYLHRNRGKHTTLIDRYNKVLHDLKEVASGGLNIPGATEASSSSGVPGSTVDRAAVQTFTRSKRDEDGTLIGNGGSMEGW